MIKVKNNPNFYFRLQVPSATGREDKGTVNATESNNKYF
jgi:hypothetical protein